MVYFCSQVTFVNIFYKYFSIQNYTVHLLGSSTPFFIIHSIGSDCVILPFMRASGHFTKICNHPILQMSKLRHGV